VTTTLMPDDDCWELLADAAFILDQPPDDLHQLTDRLRALLVAFPPKCGDRRAYLIGRLIANTVEALEREMKKRDH
jgi:hypothetical protein